MTYMEFNLLFESEKMQVIWKKGVLIAKRTEGHYDYLLYQINNFYVEEQVHRHYNVRKAYQTFRDTEKLEPYLKNVDISALVPF